MNSPEIIKLAQNELEELFKTNNVNNDTLPLIFSCKNTISRESSKEGEYYSPYMSSLFGEFVRYTNREKIKITKDSFNKELFVDFMKFYNIEKNLEGVLKEDEILLMIKLLFDIEIKKEDYN